MKLKILKIEQITLTASKLKGTNVINKWKYFCIYGFNKDELLEKYKYIITRDDGYTANNAVNDLVKIF